MLTASFRFYLTIDTLAVQLYTSLSPRRVRDFHPLERAHGAQTKNTPFTGCPVKGVHISVVLDDGCFYEELSMAEMKSILASAYTDWSEQDFKHYMDMFYLDPKRKINTLSKGMKMKYALTLALSHNAELLIMDEPTSGLDPLSRSQLLNVLNDYMENGGKGVLFSTHITSDLDKIADMLIMIHNGRIVFQEEKDFLLDNYRIIKGDKKLLTENIRQLFLNITETAFGFTGVTRHAARVQSYLPDAITERPTIEDIMLANLGGCGK